jgi:hypothetical protein
MAATSPENWSSRAASEAANPQPLGLMTIVTPLTLLDVIVRGPFQL